MILTITPDPVLDKILFIDEWIPGQLMHSENNTTSVGGKGLDASVALRHLGIETMGLCFLAGSIGAELHHLAMAYGIDMQPIWVGGETRTAHIIVESKQGRHSHLFSGRLTLGEDHLDNLLAVLREQLKKATWLIGGGIFPPCVPPSFYGMITHEAHQAGVPVLLDAHSQFIKQAFSAQPDVVKMNWQEFEMTFASSFGTLIELAHAAGEIYKKLALNALVITCGPKGLLAFTPQGAFHAQPPEMKVVNATGAGDAASAALAWRLSLGNNWPDALKWAAAASAATVLTEGTADLHSSAVDTILPQVSLQNALEANGGA
jgi:1-phosphofructokinase family hexose kinase